VYAVHNGTDRNWKATKTVLSGQIKTRLLRPSKPLLLPTNIESKFCSGRVISTLLFIFHLIVGRRLGLRKLVDIIHFNKRNSTNLIEVCVEVSCRNCS
jgi:ABC-type uncharacterized transport system permease subunit